MRCRTESGTGGKSTRGRWPRRLPLAIGVAWIGLALGVGLGGASAASKPHSSASRTFGTCTVVTHPTAAVHTKCAGANLNGAPLSHADLAYADFTGAKLLGANLAGANLTKATLHQASLGDANVSGAKWSATTCPDGANSDNVGGSCAGHLSNTVAFQAPQALTGPQTSLPFSGFDPWPLVIAGSVLIVVGVVLVELARRVRRIRPATDGG